MTWKVHGYVADVDGALIKAWPWKLMYAHEVVWWVKLQSCRNYPEHFMPNSSLSFVGRETDQQERGNCLQTTGSSTLLKPRHTDRRLPGSATFPQINHHAPGMQFPMLCFKREVPSSLLSGFWGKQKWFSGDGAALFTWAQKWRCCSFSLSTLPNKHVSTISQHFHTKGVVGFVCCVSTVGAGSAVPASV